jgi:hypothetical protein
LTAVALDGSLNSDTTAISVFVSNGGGCGCGSGDTLGPEQSLTSIVSSNGRFQFVYQGDGNVVLYDNNTGEALWASGTDGTTVGDARMQRDGNFVVYNSESTPVWASGTSGYPGATLTVQDDGNVVIYYQGSPVWATQTGGH